MIVLLLFSPSLFNIIRIFFTLFNAYFFEGRDIGLLGILREILEELEIDVFSGLFLEPTFGVLLCLLSMF